MIKLSENRMSELLFTGLYTPGVCIAPGCGMFDEYAGVEPDARKYPCPDCGQATVYGLEEALVMGAVEVSS